MVPILAGHRCVQQEFQTGRPRKPRKLPVEYLSWGSCLQWTISPTSMQLELLSVHSQNRSRCHLPSDVKNLDELSLRNRPDLFISKCASESYLISYSRQSVFLYHYWLKWRTKLFQTKLGSSIHSIHNLSVKLASDGLVSFISKDVPVIHPAYLCVLVHFGFLVRLVELLLIGIHSIDRFV